MMMMMVVVVMIMNDDGDDGDEDDDDDDEDDYDGDDDGNGGDDDEDDADNGDEDDEDDDDLPQSWNNIQLMHVFQEKIVTGASTSTAHKQIFYLVILQKLCGSSKMPDDTVYGTGVHAWKLTVSYKGGWRGLVGRRGRVWETI